MTAGPSGDDKDADLDRLMRQYPQFKRNLVELLIGDVFRPEVNAIFDTMRETVDLPDPYHG